MDCQENHRFLHAYLDGEFAERECIELECHLATCAACRAEVEYYRELRRVLRDHTPHRYAPVHLESRLHRALCDDERAAMTYSLSWAAAWAFAAIGCVTLWPSKTEVHSSERPRHRSYRALTSSKLERPRHRSYRVLTSKGTQPQKASESLAGMPVGSMAGPMRGGLIPSMLGLSTTTSVLATATETKRKERVRRCRYWKRMHRWLYRSNLPTSWAMVQYARDKDAPCERMSFGQDGSIFPIGRTQPTMVRSAITQPTPQTENETGLLQRVHHTDASDVEMEAQRQRRACYSTSWPLGIAPNCSPYR